MAEHSLWTGPAEDPQRYRVDTDGGVLEPVGDGGEGLVFHAIRVIDGEEHDVALKMLTTVGLDQYDTLAARSHSIAEVHHPHLMRQLEVFIGTGLVPADELATSDTDVLYSTSEWVPGTPFPDAVADTDLTTALDWVCQIADAIQALHDHRDDTAPDGIVHRDVKPTNIRITPDNQAVLIDYGIARPHDNLEYTKASGTYGWRPPELLGGPGTPGPPIDAWGLGAVAYWTILGTQPPLEEAAAARLRLTPPLKEHFGTDAPHVAAHIATLLEANPDNRPTNLTRWATQLRNQLTGRTRRRRRLTRTAAAAISILALGGIGLVGVSMFGSASSGGTSASSPNQRRTAPATTTTVPAATVVDATAPSTLAAGCTEQCTLTGSIFFRHPTWGKSTLFTVRAGTGLADEPCYLVAIDSAGARRWQRDFNSCFGAFAPAPDQNTDKTGNLFVLYNPGRYDGYIVLRPTATGFEDFGSIPAVGSNYGRFAGESAELIGSRYDKEWNGVFEIRFGTNDCTPTCAAGTIAVSTYHWTGTTYESKTAHDYVVTVDCGGRTCALSIRDEPTQASNEVSHVDDGETIPVTCSTRGELVTDRDSGKQSDLWLRINGEKKYINSLYATGPPVPSC